MYLSDKVNSELATEYDRRDAEPVIFLEELYAVSGDAGAVGFKLFGGHDERVIDHVFSTPGILKVHLHRSNLVEGFTSLLIAQQTNQWGLGKKGERQPFQPVTFDLAEFLEFAAPIEELQQRIDDQIRSDPASVFTIEYEQLNDETRWRALLESLQVDPELETQCGLQKQNPEPLSQRVANYPEMKELLGTTPYRHCLEEN